jgi:hypothetical protein
MAEVLLHTNTQATEFGHLTSIDLELNSVIVELVYLSCLAQEYGPNAGKVYLFEYGGQITSISYENPLNIFGFFKNVSMKTMYWVLNRTIFFQEEQEKRRAQAAKEWAEAGKTEAEADEKRQSVIQKKLKNIELGHNLRQKMVRDGVSSDEINQLIGGLLIDQRAQLLLPGPKKA